MIPFLFKTVKEPFVIQRRNDILTVVEVKADDEALQTIMSVKQTQGVNPKTLSAFKFVPLQPIIENSLVTYLEDEITKAKQAFEKFGDKVVVTFNDLAIATLAKNDAFRSTQFAQFTTLSSDSREIILGRP